MSEAKEDFMTKVKKQLQIITDKTGIDARIILAILGVAIVLTLIGFLDKYITCLVAIVLPTYWSLKAIDSKGADDDKQWLTYWCVYAVFTFFDLFFHFILNIIPLYFFVKIIFLIWCFMPNTRGALIIYDKIIDPFFKKYEKIIDKNVKQVLKAGDKVMGKAKKTIEDNKDVFKNAADKAQEVLKKSE